MKYRQINPDDVKTYPIASRESKVNVKDHFAGELPVDGRLSDFVKALPDVLGVSELKGVTTAIVEAHRQNRPVVLAMGGHVIKCGLQPVLKQLIEAKVITAVAMNGSAAIHDYEVSLIGATSEDVGQVLHMGDFGFAEETGKGINDALREGMDGGDGFGWAVGKKILTDQHPHQKFSLLATCVENDIPASVHVAIGTDIIHQHPTFDGAVTGEMSSRDFRLLTSVVSELKGGVWLNIGSAVIMPEVFLKALSIAQNLGSDVSDITTANFDMKQHYRPLQNVVKRPTSGTGCGYSVTGHHEINIPLLAAMVLDSLNSGA